MKNTNIPSIEQTDRFVQLVSREHSWYKHLDREVPTDFIFFLDPNARRPFKLDNEGNVIFDSVTDEQMSVLNSQYGTWRYYNANYTAKFFTDSDGFYRDLNPFIGLSIIGQAGRVIALPQNIIDKGRIGLTAYLHCSFKDYEPTMQLHKQTIDKLRNHLLLLRTNYIDLLT